MGRGLEMATARLVLAVVTIVAGCFLPGPAQDWFPFQIAARMAATGAWSELYPPPSATSQFDHSAAYVAIATTRDGPSDPAIARDYLTAFVSPPPAALLLMPFGELPWRYAQTGWRLALAIPSVISMLWLAAAFRDQRAKLEQWSWVALVSAPLLFYTAYMGQPTAWLFTAAVITIGPSTKSSDLAGGLALMLGILCKATPAIVVVLLWFAGRRRLAAIAVAGTVAVALLTIPATGLGAWHYFARSSADLSAVVITGWNNASIDAAMMRWSVGESSGFHPWSFGPWLTAQAIRVLLLILTIRAVATAASPPTRVACAWLGWLASTPLLWLHYLLLLGPAVVVTNGRRATAALAAYATLPAVLVARIAGWQGEAQGYLLSAAWLAVALLVLVPQDRRRVVPE